MRSSNPTMNTNVFKGLAVQDAANAMTINGTVNKTFILLFLVTFSAYWAWTKMFQIISAVHQETGTVPLPGNFIPIAMGAGLAALGVGLVTVFKKEWAGITAPIYALLEGVLLGSISVLFEYQYPGIVIQAIALTFGTLFSLLLAYRSGLIRVTEKFRLGIVAATGGIFLLYVVNFIMGFFGGSMSFIYAATPMGIGFSVVVVIIAALNLILDFDFIERGAACGAPKYMEWYGAFGLMVTLVWLYVEILILLSKLRRR